MRNNSRTEDWYAKCISLLFCIVFVVILLVGKNSARAENTYTIAPQNTDKKERNIEGGNIGQDPFAFKTAKAMYTSGPVKPFDTSAQGLIQEIEQKLQNTTSGSEDSSVLALLRNLNLYRRTAEVQEAVTHWAAVSAQRIRNQRNVTEKNIFDRAKKYMAKTWDSHQIQGDDLYLKGDFDKASEIYRAMLSRFPMYPDARNNLALAQLHLSNDLIAQFELEILSKIQPDYLPAAINLAVVLERSGQSDRAKELVFQINKKRDDVAIAAFNAAWYRSINGEYSKAIKLLKPLSELNIKEKYTTFYQTNIDLEKYHQTKRTQKKTNIKENNYKNIFDKAQHFHNSVKNYDAAFKLYQKAAAKGHTGAMNSIGIMYEYGEGVQKDSATAVKWYRKAAEKGHVTAMYNLGVMYAKGKGVTKNGAKAAEWYQKAAKKGDADAMNNLGVIYEKGMGVTRSYGGAIKWYRMAAEKGHDVGMKNLGRMYDMGKGVDKNTDQAIHWYLCAVKKGNADAMNNLGLIYESKKEYQQAVKWYRKAMRKNHPGATGNLGFMYEKGSGVKKNLTEARRLYRKASKLGSPFAEQSLNRLESYN